MNSWIDTYISGWTYIGQPARYNIPNNVGISDADKVDLQLKGLSATGKLFKLKAMAAKNKRWFYHSENEYVAKLLEEISIYGRIQPKGTNTKSIEESFPICRRRTFQPYSFDRPDWTPLQPTRKLTPIVKKAFYQDLQPRSTYNAKKSLSLL